MNQTKTRPLASPTIAGGPKTPYTAARQARKETVTGTRHEESFEALDRRVTEGFNLVHGRLDVITEDVRENRRDIKGLRQELWDGFREATADRHRIEKEAAADRSRLASRADLDSRAKEAAADRRRIELAFKADLDSLAKEAAADRHRIEKEAAADRSRLASKADLEKFAQEAAADRRRIEKEAAADRRRLEEKFDAAHSALRAEMNARFLALEESNRQIIALVSRVLERTEATAWTRRRLWVAVAAGTSLLVIGAVLRPVLERAVAALFGG